jgi:hypothetical protein
MQFNWLARPDGDPRVVKPYYLLKPWDGKTLLSYHTPSSTPPEIHIETVGPGRRGISIVS